MAQNELGQTSKPMVVAVKVVALLLLLQLIVLT
jgi:hypothetical protein